LLTLTPHTLPRPPISPLFPYTTLFRSHLHHQARRRPSSSSGLPALTNTCADLDRGKRCRTKQRLGELSERQSGRGRPCLLCPLRSEEHTSELQSRVDLVCRLLLEKKKN